MGRRYKRLPKTYILLARYKLVDKKIWLNLIQQNGEGHTLLSMWLN